MGRESLSFLPSLTLCADAIYLQDINNHVSINAAREAEEEYFRTHPVYSVLKDRAGSKYLAKTLNKLLMHHIRECLPELRHRVNALLAIKVCLQVSVTRP